MKFSKVTLHNFRNFTDTTVELGPNLNFFIGQNGQGKTNFLEAMHLLSHGRGFRPGKNETFLRQDHESKVVADRARLSAVCERQSFDYQVQTDFFKTGKKQTLLNGKKSSGEQVLKLFSSILFSPESLAAIKGGPELRRDLVDDLLISHNKNSAPVLAQFRRALLQRNRLLRWLREGEKDLPSLKATLQTLNSQFLPLAVDVSYLRICALREIQPELSAIARQILGHENVEISVDYQIASQSALTWDENTIFDSIKKRMSELEEAEFASGTSLVGPQKHDISFLFDGQDSRFFCSQGQQRALILSYKMAQIMYHQRIHSEQPILLLDDVMSELDRAKQEYLVNYLKGLETQIILTTTDYSYPKEFANVDMRVFHVENGRISRG